MRRISLVAMLVALFPAVAGADDLGAIGKGGAVILALAVGAVLVIACIVLAVMLGRWIAKPSKVSGFVVAGTGLILAAGWFLLLGLCLGSELSVLTESKDIAVTLAWGLLGGGVLSIAPVIVVIRGIKLLLLLVRKGSTLPPSPPSGDGSIES